MLLTSIFCSKCLKEGLYLHPYLSLVATAPVFCEGLKLDLVEQFGCGNEFA